MFGIETDGIDLYLPTRVHIVIRAALTGGVREKRMEI